MRHTGLHIYVYSQYSHNTASLVNSHLEVDNEDYTARQLNSPVRLTQHSEVDTALLVNSTKRPTQHCWSTAQ